MKKVLILIIPLIFIFLNSTLAFAESYAEVTEDRLRIREGADTSYNVISFVNKGDKLTILDDSPTNGWYHIQTQDGSIIGYANGDFLNIVNIEEDNSNTASTTQISDLTAMMHLFVYGFIAMILVLISSGIAEKIKNDVCKYKWNIVCVIFSIISVAAIIVTYCVAPENIHMCSLLFYVEVFILCCFCYSMLVSEYSWIATVMLFSNIAIPVILSNIYRNLFNVLQVIFFVHLFLGQILAYCIANNTGGGGGGGSDDYYNGCSEHINVSGSGGIDVSDM